MDNNAATTSGNGTSNAGATAWISWGFEELVAERGAQSVREGADFDVVIVGSGYGGAVAAAELAGCTDKHGRKISVCVLERGKEYLPGMFPPRMADLAGHVRFSTAGAAGPRGEREGLFDVRVGPDVSALVANGLGGGSLINAGVMAEPDPGVFQRPEWPKRIRDDVERACRFAQAREMLGAVVCRNGKTEENTVLLSPDRVPAKYRALERLARGGAGPTPFRAAAITVAIFDKHSSSGVALSECVRCGDCVTGCNHGAKDSLDVNLLYDAVRREAKIYTGATVLRIERAKRTEPGTHGRTMPVWCLDVAYTDARLRARQGGPFKLTAAKVILAAGTFGSTEILLRSRSETLEFSARLGQRFSTNGDMIAVAYHQKIRATGAPLPVNANADENEPPDKREVGPTITGIIDRRPAAGANVVIEELAVPGPLGRLFEEIITTGHTLQALAIRDADPHRPSGPTQDPCAVEREAVDSSSMFAVMGDDGAGGALELVGGDDEHEGDGAIRVRWPEARDHPLFTAEIDALQQLAGEAGIDAQILPNPLWQMVPRKLEFLFENKRGPLFTVHPLGGCPMGERGAAPPIHDLADAAAAAPALEPLVGVVDDLGRVFDPLRGTRSEDVHPGLVVLDGSIIPTALGINPSLTIAALALRAIALLRSDHWQFTAAEKLAPVPVTRPIFRELPLPVKPRPTEVQIRERMSGTARLPSADGVVRPYVVEITLRFDAVALAKLVLPPPRRPAPKRTCAVVTEQTLAVDGSASQAQHAAQAATGPVPSGGADKSSQQDAANVAMERKLNVDAGDSRLRVYAEADWKAWRRRGGHEAELEQLALLSAPLSGSLSFLQREASTYAQRSYRSLRAWFCNRGVRDVWQELKRRYDDGHFFSGTGTEASGDDPRQLSLCQEIRVRWQDGLALASHAGEVRRFDYTLTLGDPIVTPAGSPIDAGAFHPGRTIRGSKRLTYNRRANPWWQLMRMTLEEFPGLPKGAAPVLELDTGYLAQQRVPLLRVVGQEDQPSAIADLASFGAYFLRLLLTIHVWSFRKPDPPEPREPQRLPGMVDGLPAPEITELDLDRLPDGRPVRVRLTRYPRHDSRQAPVVMIHGYSASGTTFAHHAVNPNLARYLWDRNRDVWILDLRTSSGMPTARQPWAFEDAALADIPAAFEHICRTTKQAQLDVFAHCMGAAMFSMAVLTPPAAGDRYVRERMALPGRIRKAVLSQIGPVVVFTPANVFRAYLMSYLRHFLPLAHYEFRVGANPSLTDQLIDRLLSTLPYPDAEYDIENPSWPPCRRTPFVGTRHRMDALYGRDFSLANIARAPLDYIDDLFGPLSTDTVSQAINFARLEVITNRAGRNDCVLREHFLRRWTFDTLSIHGEDNGLADVATLTRMHALLKRDLARSFETRAFANFGHQDCLIGRNAKEVFDVVHEFLERAPQRDEFPAAATRDGPGTAMPPAAVAPAGVPLQDPPLRFKADIPWIGPILGAMRVDGSGVAQVPLAAVVDPAPGRAFGVVLVPVARRGERYVAVDMDGAPQPVQNVWRSTWTIADAHGWFSVDMPAESWSRAVAGVLMILLYSESIELQYYTYADLANAAIASPNAPSPTGSAAIQVPYLPRRILSQISEALAKRMWQGILDAVNALLDTGLAATLEQGLAIVSGPQVYADPAAGDAGTSKPQVDAGAHPDQELSFALGSCQYPSGLLEGDVAGGSWTRLAQRLNGGLAPRPECLLLVGDQVYVDGTAGLFDPTSLFDRYVRPYEILYRMSPVRDVLRQLPAYMLLDDHEIEDNWEPRIDDQRPDPVMIEGRRSYLKFQRTAGPPQEDPVGDSRDPSWYSFGVRGFPFFMADTRTERMPRTANAFERARIMSCSQFERLLEWLERQHRERCDIPKFIATSSILLPRHARADPYEPAPGAGREPGAGRGVAAERAARSLHSDGWDGYPYSFHRLLASIAEMQVRHVVFLSGDEHLACVARATITPEVGAPVVIHSVHGSPLFAPFPFANSERADLRAEDSFAFVPTDARRGGYRCRVTAKFGDPGDGFALLSVRRADDGWTMRCEFDRDPAAGPGSAPIDCRL